VGTVWACFFVSVNVSYSWGVYFDTIIITITISVSRYLGLTPITLHLLAAVVTVVCSV